MQLPSERWEGRRCGEIGRGVWAGHGLPTFVPQLPAYTSLARRLSANPFLLFVCFYILKMGRKLFLPSLLYF
jgi:hypothetical protein